MSNQVMVTVLNPIDDQTHENYMRQVIDVFVNHPVAEFSAHQVTNQARALHPNDFIEHKPDVVHALMLNLMAGGLDYVREVKEDTTRNVSYWLYKHINPASQVIVQAQTPATPPTLGIAVSWEDDPAS